MVIRKRLLATVGWRSTSNATSCSATPVEVERRLDCARDALHVAVHLRRLAEQHVHRHVDRRGRRAVVGRRTQLRAPRSPRRPPRTGSARARTSPRTAAATPARSPARSAPGSRCTRSPSAPGRSPRAAPCAGRSARRGRRRRPARERRCDRPPAPTSWIARIGFALAQRPAMVDDLLRAALDLGVAALHRIEVELGGVGAGRHRAGRAAAHADAHAGAAELDQQRAGRELDLAASAPAAIVPRPPAIMIGL